MLRQSPLCRRECATGKGPDSGNQALASTEDLLSTSGWRELLADFTTGPQTRLIAIKVMRLPGNPLIKGTFWLDDVKLALAQTAAADDEASP
jgi:hypothetical protein